MKSTKNGRLRAHCPRCRHQQLFVQTGINHGFNLLLSIVTGGLWLVSWLALCIGRVLRPWRCEHCGWHKPEFRVHASADHPGTAKAAAKPAPSTAKRPGPLRQVAAWIYS